MAYLREMLSCCPAVAIIDHPSAISFSASFKHRLPKTCVMLVMSCFHDTFSYPDHFDFLCTKAVIGRARVVEVLEWLERGGDGKGYRGSEEERKLWQYASFRSVVDLDPSMMIVINSG